MMGSVCVPRKVLLNRRAAAVGNLDTEMYLESPTKLLESSSALFRKFLPYNNLDDDDDDDPYSADHFRMYEFKVRRCTRSRSHDWTDCPFAHPGEKARRRDPRKFHYSGAVCSEFRKGSCSRGDNCEFAHGVFECWLHPARYRTEACKDGKNCKRKVCFFAHSPRQLRVLPVNRHRSGSVSPVHGSAEKYRNLSHCGGGLYNCHSPTSTLMGISGHVSPPLSPTLSPERTPFCPCCGGGGVETPYGVAAAAQMDAIGMMSYKDALTELVSSLEAMNVKHVSPLSPTPATAGINRNMNLSLNIPSLTNANLVNGVDQPQFSLSPSTPDGSYLSKFLVGGNVDFSPRRNTALENRDGGDGKYNSDGGLTGIDLGWVNDLLT